MKKDRIIIPIIAVLLIAAVSIYFSATSISSIGDAINAGNKLICKRMAKSAAAGDLTLSLKVGDKTYRAVNFNGYIQGEKNVLYLGVKDDEKAEFIESGEFMVFYKDGLYLSPICLDTFASKAFGVKTKLPREESRFILLTEDGKPTTNKPLLNVFDKFFGLEKAMFKGVDGEQTINKFAFSSKNSEEISLMLGNAETYAADNRESVKAAVKDVLNMLDKESRAEFYQLLSGESTELDEAEYLEKISVRLENLFSYVTDSVKAEKSSPSLDYKIFYDEDEGGIFTEELTLGFTDKSGTPVEFKYELKFEENSHLTINELTEEEIITDKAVFSEADRVIKEICKTIASK